MDKLVTFSAEIDNEFESEKANLQEKTLYKSNLPSIYERDT